MSAEFGKTLGAMLARQPLGAADARAAVEAILGGAWTPIQIGAFAVALRMLGETPEAIAGAAEAMRGAMTVVEHGLPRVIDTCGTGGDGSHTLNLSTAAALVVAGCGLPVAKHGNRSASSQCGSADVFEALGIPIDVPAARQGELLREVGIVFLFAQAHHPALKHAAQARSELKTRTLFNVLGPISNPARATHQLVGVYDDALRSVLARALGRLGSERAWVVHSEDGLDEVSPCAPTRVSELAAGDVREMVVAPEDFGLRRIPRSAIAGSDAQSNARAILSILAGEPHPATDAVILNAAAALAVTTGDPLRACAERARGAIASGAARSTLERWRAAAQRARAPIERAGAT
ncbi:MAG TPA: anthranilate phosphoribosyltransferase [Polyangiaceae bacterium]|nr:anthranilate phosphoribosyltransferase [Polyangiaceae bacterium]